MQLNDQKFGSIITDAWASAQQTGGQTNGQIRDDGGRSAEGGQAGGQAPQQAMAFAANLLQGLHGAGCTQIQDALGYAQRAQKSPSQGRETGASTA